MSTFNIKSNIITQRDATGLKTLLGPQDAVGVVKEVIGVDRTSAAIVDAGTTIRLCPVPSRARIVDVQYARETLGTSALDIAVWYPTDIPQGGEDAPAASNEAALISSSAFATNITGTDAGLDWTSGLGLATAPTLQARTQPLWQLLGLSQDPGIDLDLGFTVRTATAEQGYVGMRVRYVD